MDTTLLNQARSMVDTAISVTGRQVPHKLQQKAGDLLAAIWVVSADFDIEPADWAATNARLPAACLDVLAAVERRPKFE